MSTGNWSRASMLMMALQHDHDADDHDDVHNGHDDNDDCYDGLYDHDDNDHDDNDNGSSHPYTFNEHCS